MLRLPEAAEEGKDGWGVGKEDFAVDLDEATFDEEEEEEGLLLISVIVSPVGKPYSALLEGADGEADVLVFLFGTRSDASKAGLARPGIAAAAAAAFIACWLCFSSSCAAGNLDASCCGVNPEDEDGADVLVATLDLDDDLGRR